jgi:D-alanyl-D-alanine endopeptidase (penicillin-binding protein 7)
MQDFYANSMIPARRTIVLFAFALLVSVGAFAKSKPVAPPAPEARAVLLFDQKTKTVLEGVDIHERMPIASVSKLVTAYVVLESGADLDEKVKVAPSSTDHSKILRAGTLITRRELLHMALIASDNLAARSLASAHPGGYENFIATMNTTVKLLGMNNTGFADASGLSVFNTSTAWDLHILNTAIVKYSIFNDTAMSKTATQQVDGTRGKVKQFIMRNTSALAGEFDLRLGKTGFTNAARWCIDMQVRHNGRTFDVIVLGSPSKEVRNRLAKKLIQKYTSGLVGLSAIDKIEQIDIDQAY